MSPAVRQAVRDRAGGRCEYCGFREEHLPLWPFHREHIVAEQHGGTDALENLAWSCQRCNLRKGTNLSGIDPDSGSVVRLFHPRTDAWSENFAADGDGRIRGLESDRAGDRVAPANELAGAGRDAPALDFRRALVILRPELAPAISAGRRPAMLNVFPR